MRNRRMARLVIGAMAVAGTAAAGYVVGSRDDAPPPVADDAFHGAPVDGVPHTVVNPPPEDPADVAMDTATPSRAEVRISYALADDAAGGVAIGALVAGVIEDGGECVLVLEQGGTSVSTATDGLADASTTTCGQLLVPFGDLAPGAWAATVSYTSAAGQVLGTAETSVEVPS